ncbi:ketosteroid isomerase-like protein [Crossiella equi]|uniref:Ketosteroid isomerase-like protein n=1 Tax=Crossiella equi TaxID=130796 RepID=A0ABS5ARA6_9PSEU|nr:nuclear transport factor 2 family protein [Crossiella equi]MBP2479086.1 ketosteroid isomerase-like protein [Crossiella equi]
MTAVHPNAETLRAIYANLDLIGEHLAEDAVLHPATRDVDPDAGPVRGAAAVVRWETELVAATGGTLVMDVQRITANDQFGTVLGTLRAVLGGREYADAFCGVWRFRDGRVVEHWENIHDPHGLRAALAQMRQ